MLSGPACLCAGRPCGCVHEPSFLKQSRPFVFSGSISHSWLLLIPLALCAEATWHDLRTREIPDSVSIRLLATALIAAVLGWHHLTWQGVIGGAAAGFLVTLPFAWTGGLGGGDLKLVAGLGAWLGPFGIFGLLFWTALAGMVGAIIATLRAQENFPYVPAIMVGLTIQIVFPDSLPHLVVALRSLGG
ncbi:A24 family peptidase [Maioricimonas sp. JC845]|uniref:A24 family peptidase n=1 Tax=Maioricimonas sp. JC845 TaxID=3232138 RepID=UPI00345808C2